MMYGKGRERVLEVEKFGIEFCFCYRLVMGFWISYIIVSRLYFGDEVGVNVVRFYYVVGGVKWS